MRKLLFICLLACSTALTAQNPQKPAAKQPAKTANAPKAAAAPKATAAQKTATPAQKATAQKATAPKAAAKTSTPAKTSAPAKTNKPANASQPKTEPKKAAAANNSPASKTPAKATPQKAAPAKAAPQKTTPQKAAPAKSAPEKSTQAKPTQSSKTQSQPPTGSVQKLKKEQATLQQQIKESETQIKSNKANVSAQLANLAVITGQIGTQKEYVSGIKSEIDTIARNINALSTDIMFLEDDLAECKRKYAQGVMFMYRTRLTQNKLTFIFSAKDFRQMYRRIRYAQEYSKYQRAQGIIVQHKQEAIKTKREELHAASSKKKDLLSEGQKQQRELENQQNERQAVVDDLNKKQRELQATLANQKNRSQQLNARIDQLVQEEIRKAEERKRAEESRKAEKARKQAEEAQRKAAAERKQQEEAAKAKSKTQPTANAEGKKKGKAAKETTASSAKPEPKSNTTPGFNAPDNADRKLSSNFAANKGSLPVPITGSYVISAHYGLYSPEGLNGVTLENKGTNYTGKMGAQARCIFDGEVTSVFNLGGMTNIIVRHGNYISVYCNLSSSNVRVGQKVSARQTLGSVARDASGNATLHFQLRKETSKLNPEQWIGK